MHVGEGHYRNAHYRQDGVNRDEPSYEINYAVERPYYRHSDERNRGTHDIENTYAVNRDTPYKGKNF